MMTEGDLARFPDVTGSNLLRRRVRLPAEFEGELNLVLIAFQQWQQSQVDTWLPAADRLEKRYPGLRYYELPTIQHRNVVARTFINEGMRAGIPDPDTRARTITLYLDKMAFREALGIDAEDRIHALLVDRQGRVHWRASGVYAPEAAAGLPDVIERLLGAVPDRGDSR